MLWLQSLLFADDKKDTFVLFFLFMSVTYISLKDLLSYNNTGQEYILSGQNQLTK